MNKVVLIGRLAQNPEIRYTAAGKPICAFSIAIDGYGKDSKPDFVDCVTWDKLAETCGNYLTKGRKVALDGRLSVRKYETNEGLKKKVVEVICHDVEFLDSPKKGGNNGTEPAASFGGEEIPY